MRSYPHFLSALFASPLMLHAPARQGLETYLLARVASEHGHEPQAAPARSEADSKARRVNRIYEKHGRLGIVRIYGAIDKALSEMEMECWGGCDLADIDRALASAASDTGIDTVLADDPQLTVRDSSLDTLGRQPLRVVLDSALRMPASARMLKEPGETLVLTAAQSGTDALRAAGAKVVTVARGDDGRVDLPSVLRELGALQCNDLLIESGPTLAGRFLDAGLVDELIVYMAPVVLGPDARPMLQLPRLERLADRIQFDLLRSERIGTDLKLVLRPQSTATK